MKQCETIQNISKVYLLDRASILNSLNVHSPYDVIVIGGGATGLGIALDATTRGYKTLLLEQVDFAKGTSSRSTKLVHGGVRYLAQGNIGLVREALRERGLLLKNAPHLVKNQSFVIPNYRWWEGAFYTVGLKMYDLLAGKLSLGASIHISRKKTLNRINTIRQTGLNGGVVYHDGQFDDSRLAINLAQTCQEKGATVLNHFKVTGLLKSENDIVSGVNAQDMETGKSYQLSSKVVVNATGVFTDDILQLDNPSAGHLVRPSQGIHLVLDQSFLPGKDAIMIPKTDDGRVLFLVPWHDKVVVGTTDTLLDSHSLEPTALQSEIDFVINTANRYLTKEIQKQDVLSIFAGLRPLAAPQGKSEKTKEISRSHKIIFSSSGLVSITGGKWTTYRKMAEDTLDKIIKQGKLPPRPCSTYNLPIHGAMTVNGAHHLDLYGSDKDHILKLIHENPELGIQLHPELPFLKAEVVWAVQNEMARTVEDVLARRVRALFLNARAACECASEVAEIMAVLLNKDAPWKAEQIATFKNMAKHYYLE